MPYALASLGAWQGEAMVATCIVCGGSQLSRIERITYSDVWAWLERDFDVSVPSSLRRPLTPKDCCDLIRCIECEVEFFAPAVPATPEFYELLATTGLYYQTERWEFTEVAKSLTGTECVVDFAAGAGRFSELAAIRGCAVIAVDSNPSATVRHPRVELSREMPTSAIGSVDVFCGFQVIEHVQEPVQFARMAREIVRPGGMIALSVPNRHRIGRQAGEPLDHPPHHMSRWTPRTMEALAVAADLELEHLLFERPIPSDVRSAIVRPLARLIGMRAARIIGRAAYPSLADKALYRRNAHARLQLYGHTMLACYRRPI